MAQLCCRNFSRALLHIGSARLSRNGEQQARAIAICMSSSCTHTICRVHHPFNGLLLRGCCADENAFKATTYEYIKSGC